MATRTREVAPLSAAWDTVLDRVAAALAAAQQAAEARAQALSGPSADAAPPPEARWQPALRTLDERLVSLEVAAARAGERISDVESHLRAEEEAVSRWHEEVRAIGGRLANWTAGPV